MRRLEDGDTASSVLAEFLGLFDGLDAEVRADVVPIIRWGEAIQQELSEGWSRVIQHDLTGKLDGPAVTVDFPV